MLRSETTERQTNIHYLPNQPLMGNRHDPHEQTSLLVYCIVVLSFTLGWVCATISSPTGDQTGKHIASYGRFGHVSPAFR
jgi:hypothetical protein